VDRRYRRQGLSAVALQHVMLDETELDYEQILAV